MERHEPPKPRIPPGYDLVPEEYAIPEYEAMRIVWDPAWTIRGTYSEALTALALARGALLTASRIMDEVGLWGSDALASAHLYRRMSESSATVRALEELLAGEMEDLKRSIDELYGRSDWE